MASSSETGALERLETAVTSTLALCHQLAASLDNICKNPSDAPKQTTDPNIIPLDLARDAATLVRAHSTKLTLLLINEPYTPSAIVDVLKQLLSGPVLGVASAAEACDPSRYTAFFRKELAWRSKRVLVTLAELLGKIPKNGAALSGPGRGGFAADGKGSLPSTGILWSACDEVLALVHGGVGSYFVKRVDEWKNTLKDVMEELKEWSAEEPNDDDDEDDDEFAHEDNADVENNAASTQAMVDDLMSPGQAIPHDDPRGIRPRLDSSLRRVRLVVLLYQAISKRRLSRLPHLPLPADTAHANVPRRLDEAAGVLGALPDSFSDLAMAFYEMEPAEIDQAADDCFFAAFAAGELLNASWDGGQDEFSEWTEKFKAEIKRS
ncbi:hypothetical protein V2A60_007273 [Cordyceps javanica]